MPLPTMPITEEINAVESRLAEIENEMSEAHRDHAFDYWWQKVGGHASKDHAMRRDTAREAFNRAHMLYSHAPKIIIERPPVCGLYALFAIGVVVGLIIAFTTYLLTVSPN